MRKYAKLECTEDEYQKIQDVQFTNNSFVSEQYIGSRKKLFSKGKMIATVSLYNNLELGGISKTQFNAFLGAFNKQLYKRFADNQDLYELKIDFKGFSREKNYEEWECLKNGDYFYNVDLKSAYWQVANKLGYLNDKMFNTYFATDEYKMAKRVCISFLARKNYMVYHPKHPNEGESFKIHCDTSVLKNVYRNIRHYLYNTMVNCVKNDLKWLEYNIDGITVTAENLIEVQMYFQKLGLKYKITECRKLNDNEYLYGTKERKFRNR
jgi:hypothetical protein